MNEERLILKGALQDLKMKRMGLETSISANLKAVKSALALAGIKLIAKIDIEGALVNLKEAAAQKKELTEVIAKIAKIDEELS